VGFHIINDKKVIKEAMEDAAGLVKKANREFYNILGRSEKEIRWGRSSSMANYVKQQMERLAQATDGDSMLDLGCGNGFIIDAAKRFFRQRYAIDISYDVLRSIKDKALLKINSDFDFLPIQEGQFSCVVTFAVLHHSYSFERIFSEIYRILKKNGIYYSDHDVDAFFFKKFRPLLTLYRAMTDEKKYFLKKYSSVSREMYDYSEYHRNGIASDKIGIMLKEFGFRQVKIQYHWFGLSGPTDLVFRTRCYKRGYAPMVRILAVK